MAKGRTRIKYEGPGRPHVAEPRRNRVSANYTDAELAALTKAAKGQRLSDYVRAKSLS